MRKIIFILFMIALAGNTDTSAQHTDARVLIPRIDGDWWQIAGDPDLGEYTSEKQQPVDFAIWQAADGTWQLWSCIRNNGVNDDRYLISTLPVAAPEIIHHDGKDYIASLMPSLKGIRMAKLKWEEAAP
jgi:hypothetical protein